MKPHIPTRSEQCCHGNHDFQHQDLVISHLYKDKEGNWTRKDYCSACLENLKTEERPYCSWQSPFSSKEKKVEATPLLEFFRGLYENSDPSDPKELYFLAEVLLRQKLLLRRSRSKKEMVLEDAASHELYALERFDLSLGEVRCFSVKYVPEIEEEINSDSNTFIRSAGK